MHIKMAGRLLAAAFLSLASGCQPEVDGTQPEASTTTQELQADAQCVERFPGIKNCATGKARLAATEQGVQVSGLANPKTDGVSSQFAGAVSWTQQTQLKLGDGQGSFSLAARDGDQVVSSLQATPMGRNELALTPNFTGTPEGSSYRLNVYDNGRLQGSTIYQPTHRIIIIITWWGDVYVFWGFYNYRSYLASNGSTSEGACGWRMRMPQNSFKVLIDGKEVSGDEIEFVEELGEGAYPYTQFSGIDVKGSAGAYNILGESIVKE